MATATSTTTARAPSVLRCPSRGHTRPEAAPDAADRTNTVAMKKLLEEVEALKLENLALKVDRSAAEGRYKELDASTSEVVAAKDAAIAALIEEVEGLEATRIEMAADERKWLRLLAQKIRDDFKIR